MIKIGIIFGGPSREREIAFAGGRTVYDNLNKSIFEAVPIFVDSHRNFILLDWQYIYKGTIRDFYPPVSALPHSPNGFQIYIESLGKLSSQEQNAIIAKVGRKLDLVELHQVMDMAFLSLHGSFGEDGQIQGLLESLEIPYTGSGIRACTIGMDKAFQKKVMSLGGFSSPEVMVIHKTKWSDTADWYTKAKDKIGFPMVIRPANQGSSIGVAIINEAIGLAGFEEAINNAFFKEKIDAADWQAKSAKERVEYIRQLTDIRDGLGFPLDIVEINTTIYHPEDLLKTLNDNTLVELTLESHLSEQRVIVEGFIDGKEFSCIVARMEDGEVVALPPTEIVKGGEVFDYRSKYLPGLSRKITPIDLPHNQINAIRKECERLFSYLEFNTYARIDGFITNDETIFLNDPNTTSGMLPSSFFFHQAAEIGLNPSQFLTYIIRASLQERIANTVDKTNFSSLLEQLDDSILSLQTAQKKRRKIGVFLGGYSTERHISVESGRNIFEKLASSDKYEPIPFFLTGNDEAHDIFQIPINLLLKDNADDIRDKIKFFKKHPIIEQIKEECSVITEKYASKNVAFEPHQVTYSKLKDMVDGVFIGLHGRPGEDGNVQQKLAQLGIPYNGSPYESASITIDKYRTLQMLKAEGFTVAHQVLVSDLEFHRQASALFTKIESELSYPFIAKPVDDGCSSAVKMIKNREQLDAFLKTMFREEEAIEQHLQDILGLKPKEEFPQKSFVLLEELIEAHGAKHFLEITGGLLTHYENDELVYEMFEPSEALASGEILSLEEKFLAGEGQNITPARFAKNKDDYTYIAQQVKADLERAGRILGVRGYARIDAFVRIFDDNKAETIIIEINSLPGMTPATCIFHQAAINNYKPYDFIDKILDFGFEPKRVIE